MNAPIGQYRMSLVALARAIRDAIAAIPQNTVRHLVTDSQLAIPLSRLWNQRKNTPKLKGNARFKKSAEIEKDKKQGNRKEDQVGFRASFEILSASQRVQIRETPKVLPRLLSRLRSELGENSGAQQLVLSRVLFLSEGPQMGGSDPSWLNLAFLGRPDFPSRGPKTL